MNSSQNLRRRMLEQTNPDPVMTYAYVIGLRERLEGKPLDKKRWLTSHQQRAWEEGWALMDELETLRGRPLGG